MAAEPHRVAPTVVAGGTGRLGTAVISRLRQRGLPVRVVTRDPARAAHLEAEGVEVAVADVRDRAALRAAVEGAGLVVSAIHGLVGPGRVSPASVDRDGNVALIEVAADNDADVVLVSIVGAASDHPVGLFAMKAAAEQVLRASPTAWTIVRATAFAELYVDLFRRSAARSGRPLVLGRGDNPINFVAVADVADVVVRAVTDSGLRGRVLEVGGPDNLTMNELAALAVTGSGAGSGATSRGPRHVPRTALRAMAALGRVVDAPATRLPGLALHMDTADMTFVAAPTSPGEPGEPAAATRIADLVR